MEFLGGPWDGQPVRRGRMVPDARIVVRRDGERCAEVRSDERLQELLGDPSVIGVYRVRWLVRESSRRGRKVHGYFMIWYRLAPVRA